MQSLADLAANAVIRRLESDHGFVAWLLAHKHAQSAAQLLEGAPDNSLQPWLSLPPELLQHILQLVTSPRRLNEAVLRTVTEAYGPLVTRLAFPATNLKNSLLSSICSTCADSLLSLDISSCPGLTSDGIVGAVTKLQSLSELDVKNNWQVINDNTIVPIATHLSTKLTSLKLSLAYKITNVGLQAITNHCTNLVKLELKSTSSLSLTVSDLMGGVDLIRISDLALTPLAMRCTKLRSINLRNCLRITNAPVKKLLACCPDLQVLNVKNCLALTGLAISDSPCRLRKLSADYCKFTPADLRQTLEASAGILTCLHLSYIDIPNLESEAELGRLLARASFLTKLHLCNGPDAIIDDTLQMVSENCKELQTILLGEQGFDNRYAKVSDKGIAFLANGCRMLTKVALSGLKVTDQALLALASNCPLESFSLKHCPEITNAGLEILAAKTPNLWKLNLHGIPSLTDASLQEFFASHHTTLKDIRLIDLPLLTGESFEVLSKMCYSLNKFMVTSCRSVTTSSVEHVLDCPALEEFDISHCKLINRQIVAAIEARGPLQRLYKLSIEGYFWVLTADIYRIINASPQLNELFASNCDQVGDIDVKRLDLVVYTSRQTYTARD